MGTWALVQVVIDIFAALGLFIITMRLSRQPKDDPRLSRGLQLLQSKISVLEDLSDRTETQVHQMTAILEQKCKEVQAKVQLAERHVHEIRVSMERSLDVAKIFQDKIPHQEIIERQNTIKYVQAARMAHSGASLEQISEQVDLPKGELEFIAKVNREQLMFNEESLPWWAQSAQVQAQAQALADAPPVAGTQIGDIVAATTAAAQAAAPLPVHSDYRHVNDNGMNFIEDAEMQELGGAMAPEPQADPMVDQATRMKAEMEMAEQQRLVDNLSRLQFEMQNLDMQLARDTIPRDLSMAFEAPRPESPSLQRLGEEFRRACDAANTRSVTAKQINGQANGQANGQSRGLPPLDQLSSLIPQFFQESKPEVRAEVPAAAPVAAAPSAPTQTMQQFVQQTVRQTQAPAKPVAQAPLEYAPNGALIRKVVFPRIDGEAKN